MHTIFKTYAARRKCSSDKSKILKYRLYTEHSNIRNESNIMNFCLFLLLNCENCLKLCGIVFFVVEKVPSLAIN